MPERNTNWLPSCMPLTGDRTRRMTLQSAEPPAGHKCLLLKGERMPRSFWTLTLLQGRVTGAVAYAGRVVTGMKMRSDAQDFVQRGRLRKTKVSEDSLAGRIRTLVQMVKSQKVLAIAVSEHLSEVIQLGA